MRIIDELIYGGQNSRYGSKKTAELQFLYSFLPNNSTLVTNPHCLTPIVAKYFLTAGDSLSYVAVFYLETNMMYYNMFLKFLVAHHFLPHLMKSTNSKQIHG